MRFPHILYIRLIPLVVLACLAAACTDQLETPVNVEVVEGMPASVSFRVDIQDRAQMSRAEVPDQRISSLWIGIFNANTGEKKDFFSFTDDEDDTAEETWRDVSIKTTSGVTRVVAVANFENKFAVVKNGDKTELVSLISALNNVKTFEDFENMAVTFNERAEISTSQPLNAMLMTGRYSENYSNGESHPGVIPEEDVFVISPGTFKAPGCIHLRRLISQNKFNITFNTANIKSFKVLDWQAHNVPNSSWLRERTDPDDVTLNSGEVYTINGEAVASSDAFTEVSTKDNVVSFDYWQLESLHTGLEPPESDRSAAGDYYSYREREFKLSESGASSGVFSSLVPSADSKDYNNNASYVTFTAEMEMKVDENGKPLSANIATRLVRASYTVHLGYCENKSDKKRQAMDFNCRRNSRYTYNITINNVNSMLVEANREGEPTPSIIGDITDSNQASVQLDCHYNVANLYFTQAELNNFQFAVEVFGKDNERKYYTQDNYPASGDADFWFYSWVELRKTTGEKDIADYKPHSSGSTNTTYYLHEMQGKTEGWYTVFFNEYAYERFSEGGKIDSRDAYNWHWYCGAPDRRVWFNIHAQVSEDGHTAHYSSKYAFSQTSIQTYYDKSQNIKALGVEHVNESLGINIRNHWNNAESGTRTGAGYDGTSGRYILGQYLMGAKANDSEKNSWGVYSWDKYLSIKEFLSTNAVNSQGYVQAAKTEHLRACKSVENSAEQEDTKKNISYSSDYDIDNGKNAKYMEMITACLNRNRDNNGDGFIDKNELRWFVPSHLQMMRVILGRQALRSPVMDYEGVNKTLNTANELNSRFLIACANGKILWAMEGLSTSSWYPYWEPKVQAPWNIRCVRYLGSDISDFTAQTPVNPPYRRDSDDGNVIVMDHMDSRGIRVEAYRDSKYPMPPHILNDQDYNRCFNKFEIEPSKVISLNEDIVGKTTMYLSDYLANNNPCSSLDTDTKKGWRVPNQKELSIMSTYQIPGSSSYYYSNSGNSDVAYLISCSFTFFNNEGNKPEEPLDLTKHLAFKVDCSDGQGTQKNTGTYNGKKIDRVPNRSLGVRCVRDVP